MREGVALSLSTPADQVSAYCKVVQPLCDRPLAHFDRLHRDDKPAPVLAKGKTSTGPCWI